MNFTINNLRGSDRNILSYQQQYISYSFVENQTKPETDVTMYPFKKIVNT